MQASGGAGGGMNNPYQDDGPTGNKQSSKIHSGPWGDMFAEFDGPSKNLEQALYKVKHNGKYLTKDQRRKYYDVLHNNQSFKQIAEWIGYGDALK